MNGGDTAQRGVDSLPPDEREEGMREGDFNEE